MSDDDEFASDPDLGLIMMRDDLSAARAPAPVTRSLFFGTHQLCVFLRSEGGEDGSGSARRVVS